MVLIFNAHLVKCRLKYGLCNPPLVAYNSVADNMGLSHSFSCCCLPKSAISCKNSEKIQTYSSSRSSKVIDLSANRKCTCNFLLVISSNFGRISYHFGDIDI